MLLVATSVPVRVCHGELVHVGEHRADEVVERVRHELLPVADHVRPRGAAGRIAQLLLRRQRSYRGVRHVNGRRGDRRRRRAAAATASPIRHRGGTRRWCAIRCHPTRGRGRRGSRYLEVVLFRRENFPSHIFVKHLPVLLRLLAVYQVHLSPHEQNVFELRLALTAHPRVLAKQPRRHVGQPLLALLYLISRQIRALLELRPLVVRHLSAVVVALQLVFPELVLVRGGYELVLHLLSHAEGLLGGL
mmetsp:Transcript_25169/g.58471  ORF Transcript_25169/g.58471 Transcript_25169/m.58471 type:complete len:247 (-) Transcript_25169:1191-1931(-)